MRSRPSVVTELAAGPARVGAGEVLEAVRVGRDGARARPCTVNRLGNLPRLIQTASSQQQAMAQVVGKSKAHRAGLAASSRGPSPLGLPGAGQRGLDSALRGIQGAAVLIDSIARKG